MKSTEKIFQQLKANPIAIEPLGLGAGRFTMKPEKIVGKGIVGDDTIKYNFPKFQRGDYVDGIVWGDKGVINNIYIDNGGWNYAVRFLRMDDDYDIYENELKSTKPTEELKKLRLSMKLSIGHLQDGDYIIFEDPTKEPYLHEKTNIPNVYRIRKAYKTYLMLDKMGWARRYDGKMMQMLPMTAHRVESPERSMKNIDPHHAETLLRASYYYEKLHNQLKAITK